MANTFSTEAALYLNNTPAKMANSAVHGGNSRRYRATITLASQASGDTITLARIPVGSYFDGGSMVSTVTLGTSTVAIGVAGTAAKYKAAAVFTAVDTPTAFGTAAQTGSQTGLTAYEDIILTIGVAALPAAGTLVVDLYFSAT
ncbi:hypothetical protein [Candidatus Phyllobacterium onerii]|uniref:hypothetical protein n=1 Tax=Candidatus Phyllobacterium onerii TaxID=3020828 RepID=UPI00232B9181|nr:hypothetical protein [Phyllobacterium sp. IY22]